MSHIAMQDGLISNEVLDFAQDAKGFIWMATSGGVARFDGLEFKAYGQRRDDPNRLPATPARAIAFDEIGRLWVATEQVGLNVLDPVADQIEAVDLGTEELNQGRVNRLAVDREGNVWAGLPDYGLARINPRSLRATLFTHDPDDPKSIPHENVRAIFVDSGGLVWVGTQAGIARFDPKTGGMTRVPVNAGTKGGERIIIVEAIQQASDGRIYIGNIDGQLFVLAETKLEFVPASLGTPFGTGKVAGRISFIENDRDGRLWIGAQDSGVSIIDLVTGEHAHLESDAARSRSLPDSFPQSFFQDGNGLVWIGFLNGLVKLDPYDGQFTDILVELANAGAPQLAWPWALLEDSKGFLWIGTPNGLWRYHRASGRFKEFGAGDASVGGLSSDDIASLFEADDGSIWIGTYASGANRLAPSLETAEHFSLCEEGSQHPSCNQAWAFTEDPEGIIWAGSSLGLLRFDAERNKFRMVTSPSEEASRALGSAVRQLAIRSGGGLWIGTEAGLVVWDGEDRWSLIPYRRGDASSLSNSHITSLLPAADGGVWVGTYIGLNRVDPNGQVVNHYFTQGETPSESITTIVPWNDNTLWLGTGRGISHLNPESGKVRTYLSGDGVPQENFLPGSGARGDSGRLYFGSSAHVVLLEPEKLRPDPRPPSVVLTTLAIGGHDVLYEPDSSGPVVRRSQSGPHSLEMRYGNLALSLTFAALHYASPEDNEYAYRLSGFNEHWTYTDASDRTATFTGLPWGNYQFFVKASNPDGIWSEEVELLRLRIFPPPWATWWACLLYAGAGLILISTLLRYRTAMAAKHAAELEVEVRERTAEVESQRRTIQNQAEEVAKLLDTKNRLFQDLSHELRTPLTIVLGSISEALARCDDAALQEYLVAARGSAGRVTRLVDQLLDLARLDSGQEVSRQPQPIGAYVESQLSAFAPLAEQRGVTLAAGSVANVWVACGPDPLEKILANLLSNAIKFTPRGGRVTVSVQRDPDAMVGLRVEDTGPGIPQHARTAVLERFNRGALRGESVPGAGIGLALVKELVQACGGRIELGDTDGRGTSVVVLLHRADPPVVSSAAHPTSEASEREANALSEIPVAEMPATADQEAPVVLIIEDNRELRSYVPRVLGPGYAYMVADTGEAGLEMAREGIPDVVVCDAMLPGISGFEVCQSLKKDRRTSHVPVLLLTARADDASRLEGILNRADDYVTKPFSNEELCLRIRNLLETRRVLRERFASAFVLGTGEAIEIEGPDRRFLKRLEQAVAANFHSPDFGPEELAGLTAISLRQLQRKLKALTDHSVGAYIRTYRLSRAKTLLEAGEPPGRVAMDVGFSSHSYFARCFRDLYGITPSEAREGGGGESG